MDPNKKSYCIKNCEHTLSAGIELYYLHIQTL